MKAIEAAEQILRGSCGRRVHRDFDLAPLTTFRIGGPAALFLEPQSIEDLHAAAEAHRRAGVPVVVIGKGSNILVSDSGFPGLVLRLGRGFRWSGRDGMLLSAGAAMPLPALAGVAASHSLSGLEFGVAIPASLGGAVKMNAGAHGGAIADIASSIEVFSLESDEMRRVPPGDAGFVYRGSSISGVIVAATLGLVAGTKEKIDGRMKEAREWRRATQPLAEPNCGSVFRNPPGDHAARMIEEAGGKVLSVGGASVSAKHSNFITAAPGTQASDVIVLIERIRHAVEDMFGVRLEREVHLIGDFHDEGE